MCLSRLSAFVLFLDCEKRTRDLDRGVSGGVSLDVSCPSALKKRTCLEELTEITDVTLRVGRSTVVLSERVEVGSSRDTTVAVLSARASRLDR
jgi:hypothetical protein